MQPVYTLPFSKLSKKNVALAGGKGANLGELTQAGIPVPPGFVVLAPAFEHFLEETTLGSDVDAVLQRVKHNDTNSVEQASEKIRAMFMKSRLPKDLIAPVATELKKLKGELFAVRSSATSEDSKNASWAGELDTYIFVKPKDVAQHIVKCWSSLFTPRAIFYRFEKKLHKAKVSVAVVVQEMVNSEVSGVAFTVHPVTKDRNQMIVEACLGQGEALVSGRITPDTYVIDKRDFSLLENSVGQQNEQIVRDPKGRSKIVKLSAKAGSQQKLATKEITQIAKIARQIEQHYRSPQDIEWALARKKFYLLQARPITTL